MSRILPFRLSSRPGRQFLNFVLVRELRKSRGQAIGIDIGCGEMINYELFKTREYIGTEIDQARLDAGVARYPRAKPIHASIFDAPLVQGDFVLCVQVFNNKFFDSTKTEAAVLNLCDTVTDGGRLVFNIGRHSLVHEGAIDEILRQNFTAIEKIRYEPSYLVSYTSLLSAFFFGSLMYLFPPLRTLGGYNKILYSASGKK